jgi:hypothetical protein
MLCGQATLWPSMHGQLHGAIPGSTERPLLTGDKPFA